MTDKFSKCEFNQSEACVWWWNTYIEYWLQEIELPSEEETTKAYLDYKGVINNPVAWARNFILNKIGIVKGETKL